jgi:hypothetical protein
MLGAIDADTAATEAIVSTQPRRECYAKGNLRVFDSGVDIRYGYVAYLQTGISDKETFMVNRTTVVAAWAISGLQRGYYHGQAN